MNQQNIIKANKLQELRDTMAFSAKVYRKVKKGVHSSVKPEYINNLESEKAQMMKELEEELESRGVKTNPKDEKISIGRNLVMGFNNLAIQKNEPYLVKECLKQEKKNLDKLNELVSNHDYNMFTRQMLSRQIDKTEKNIHMLQDKEKKYPYTKNKSFTNSNTASIIILALFTSLTFASSCNMDRQSTKEDREIKSDTSRVNETEGEGEGTLGNQLNR
mgnify:CR=1 FL=1